MKATGIIRNIDKLGRVVIPIEIRRSLELNTGTPVEMTFKEGCFFLKKKTAETNSFSRQIDSLGRIVLPKEIRDANELPIETPMEIFLDGKDTLVLKKYMPFNERKLRAVVGLESLLGELSEPRHKEAVIAAISELKC